MTLILTSSSDPASGAANMRDVIRALNSGIPVTKVRTLKSLVREAKTRFIVAAVALTGFGFCGIAVTIAAIFGIALLAFTSRMHEIGIRLALGASRWSVMRLFVRESMAFAAIGVAGGLALTWVAASFLKSALYGVDPHDPALFMVVPLGALAVGAICAGIATLRVVWMDARTALASS